MLFSNSPHVGRDVPPSPLLCHSLVPLAPGASPFFVNSKTKTSILQRSALIGLGPGIVASTTTLLTEALGVLLEDKGKLRDFLRKQTKNEEKFSLCASEKYNSPFPQIMGWSLLFYLPMYIECKYFDSCSNPKAFFPILLPFYSVI